MSDAQPVRCSKFKKLHYTNSGKSIIVGSYGATIMVGNKSVEACVTEMADGRYHWFVRAWGPFSDSMSNDRSPRCCDGYESSFEEAKLRCVDSAPRLVVFDQERNDRSLKR